MHDSDKPTIAEMVRKSAAKEHYKTQHVKGRRTNSAMNLRPLNQNESDEDYEDNHNDKMRSQKHFKTNIDPDRDDFVESNGNRHKL